MQIGKKKERQTNYKQTIRKNNYSVLLAKKKVLYRSGGYEVAYEKEKRKKEKKIFTGKKKK
jgi:hypothetical protein